MTHREKVRGAWKNVRAAKGFHLEGSTDKARVLKGTRSVVDKNGVYEARVEIYDAKSGRWVEKRKQSSFFPKHFSEDDVRRAIHEAYSNAKPRGDGYVGVTKQGMKIQMYIDEPGIVVSAFPEWLGGQ